MSTEIVGLRACEACGAEVAWRLSIRGGALCPHCAATVAMAILDPAGTDHVSVRDVQVAAEVLEIAAKWLKTQRLAQFGGRVGCAQ